MRLTVRTLLAWLDHVVPPDEHRELEAKAAGSAAAHQLVDRIRRVVGQPTIPAPRLDGRGLAADANSVAEYLDNCLEHDRLEAFERICIESDSHLAEVAACHHILAALARDPTLTAPVDSAGRRRLLEAMGHHAAVVSADGEPSGVVAHARPARTAVPGVADGPLTAPPRRRRSSWPAWGAAGTAVALLAVLGLLLTEAIQRSRGPGGGAREERAIGRDQPLVDAPPRREAPPVAALPSAEPAPEERVPDETVAEPPPEEAPPVAAAAPAADAEATLPAMPVSEARVPDGEALAIAAPRVAAPARPDEPPPVPPVPADGEAALGFVGGGGIVMQRGVEAGRPAWKALAAGAALGPREELIAPFGFQPELNVRGITIRLLPGTRATITGDADGTPRLELVFGRAIVRSGRPDARVGVAAAGLTGTITAGLAEPAAVCVDLERMPGADPTAVPVRTRASVIAANGGIVWRQAGEAAADGPRLLEGIAPEGMLEARTAIEWESVAPGVGRIVRLDALPAWLAAPAAIDKLQRNAAEALAERVLVTPSLEQALRELADDRRVENRVLAASTLALLGDFDAAVESLCAEGAGRRLEQRQWLALEAATVPLALARGANAAARLRTAFENRGPHGKAEALFAMARGFGDEELAAGAAEALVSALDDADLVVRRYAIKCLCEIVQPAAADRLRYRADGLPELRREGVAWWRGQLQKGLIRRRGAA